MAETPFGGDLVDGEVWGRGAVDMKGAVAMFVSAFLRAARGELELPGDLILVVLSDEENGGDFGAKFLVQEHPELFDGVRHALGEAGGISQVIAGKRFYPIHVTPIVRGMIQTIAAHLPRPKRELMLALLKPAVANRVLPRLGPQMRPLETLLRNTVNATIVRGGEKVNVIPAQIDLELDGRLLPGFTPDDLIGELHGIIGDDIAVELVRHDAAPAEPDLALFEMLPAFYASSIPRASRCRCCKAA